LIQHVVAQRVYPTVYETGKLARLLVLAIAAGSVGLVTIEPVWLSLVVKTAVLLAFVVSIRVAHVVDEDDLTYARRLVAARFRRDAAAP